MRSFVRSRCLSCVVSIVCALPAAGQQESRAPVERQAYALVQQGRVREARALVDSMLRVRERERTPAHEALAMRLAATHVVETNAWDSPLATLRFDSANLHGLADRTRADFYVGFAAARRAARPVDLAPGSRAADRALADSMLERIAARTAAARARGHADDLREAAVMELMLRAEQHVLANRPDSAIARLREAAARLETLPAAPGPPAVIKPPRERIAEILMVTGRNAQALAELENTPPLAPERSLLTLRRARALLNAGRSADAAQLYRQLADAWRNADPLLPDLEEVRWGSSVLAASGAAADVAVDTITYRSGELPLRGALYRPARDGRHPALVVLHGSASCWRIAEADVLGRLFAAEGYVTFFPCRRGLGLSAGQGTAILDQLQREGLTTRDSAYAARSTELLHTTQLPDVRAAIDALRLRADVDPARVAVTGLSYGGILTLLAAAADSTLAAAVAFAPAAMNWGWNPPLRQSLADAGRRTRIPVLVLQAENDWHTGPTRELPEVIRAAGGDATGKLYPAIGGNAGDGHALMVLAPIAWRDDVLAFLRRHVHAP